MKKRLAGLVIAISLVSTLVAQPIAFGDYFEDATLRIDTVHVGDAKEQWVTLDKLYRTETWAGAFDHTIDTFNNGRFFARVYDAKTGTLIFSKGFNSIFSEYMTTGEAGRGVKRAFSESVLMPFPKHEIRFTLWTRNRDNSLKQIFETTIRPDDVTIIRDVQNHAVERIPIAGSSDPHHSLDLAIVADGYTARQRDKAIKDAKHFAGKLLNMAPYNRHKDHINVVLVYKPSQDAGCTEPTRGIYKKTAVGSSFNSLGLPRYLLTENNRDLRNIASVTPYDIAVVMVNQKRYGGGGIYNFFCVFTSDNSYRNYVFLHEFGHAFGGLGDEYYSSAVTYDEFYPKGVEPLDPNITALLDPKHVKWQNLLSPGVAVPTDWGKSRYDAENVKYQKKRRELDRKIATLTREKAPETEIEQTKAAAAKLSRQNKEWVDRFFAENPMKDKVGAFEGAGYTSKGLYRPMLDCIMFSKGEKPFCKVCEAAIEARLQFYIQ